MDEARFAVRCKYNGGRVFTGDHVRLFKDSDAEILNKNNHGVRCYDNNVMSYAAPFGFTLL